MWDAGVGVVERGSWSVKEAVEQKPWLPDGPIPLQVDWRKPGYQRVSHGHGLAAMEAALRATPSPGTGVVR